MVLSASSPTSLAETGDDSYSYFRKQAGIFALQLKEDQPCPICGSLHHPHPAQIEKEDITKEKLDQ